MFEDTLELLLEDKKYTAAVAIIQYNQKWLLGLAKCSDDRNNKWCFVGGGIKTNETPKKAAVREAKEESNVNVKAVGDIIDDSRKKHVAFIHCRVTGVPTVKPNNEFAAMAFFTEKEMKSLKLYNNVIDLIRKVKC